MTASVVATSVNVTHTRPRSNEGLRITVSNRKADSGCERRRGRDRNETVVDLGYGLSPGLISLLTAGAHGDADAPAQAQQTTELGTSRQSFGSHTASGRSSWKPQAQPLAGKAVLTLGVFRRSSQWPISRRRLTLAKELLARVIVTKWRRQQLTHRCPGYQDRLLASEQFGQQTTFRSAQAQRTPETGAAQP